MLDSSTLDHLAEPVAPVVAGEDLGPAQETLQPHMRARGCRVQKGNLC